MPNRPPAYPPTMRVGDALERFFADNDYGPDGGLSRKWVKVIFKPSRLFIYIPNIKARREALPLHDLHHIATGYGTDMAGEAEIGAWEIGGGCGRYWVAWVLDFGAFAYGWIFLPRRMFAAFVNGSHTRNLYPGTFEKSFLELSVAELRQRLDLDQPARPATCRDALRYLGWVIFDLVLKGILVAAIVLIVLMLFRIR